MLKLHWISLILLSVIFQQSLALNKIPELEDSELLNELILASENARIEINDLFMRKEPEILRKGQFLQKTHPASRLSSFNNPTHISVLDNKVKNAQASLLVAKNLLHSTKIDFQNIFRSSQFPLSLKQTPLKGFCQPTVSPDCPSSAKYRTFEGTCNNLLVDSNWGSANTLFHRFLDAEYSDGIDSLRLSVSGSSLPSARLVSLAMHNYKSDESDVTMYVPQWGQFLDHDITATRGFTINGTTPKCCGVEEPHPECSPIEVPRDDPFFPSRGVNCLNFVRSVPGQDGCELTRREQINTITSFIDGSQVYGNNLKVSNQIRIHRKGLLQFGNGTASKDTCVNYGGFRSECIKTGDHARHDEQPGLLAMHTLFVIEHNRIALELGRLNPKWNDETLYQETRRIIIAILQHITYNEFLPVVLGDDVCDSFDLKLRPAGSGPYLEYSPLVNPSIANGFATAAYRFGHALVPDMILRSDKENKNSPSAVPLHEENDRGDIGGSGSLHRILRGLSSQKTLDNDRFMSYEMTRHLFQGAENNHGIDLAAVNIQRGRDHGLPGYVRWRDFCKLSEVKSWHDLSIIIGTETVEKLRTVYESVEDIDLFSGGLSEKSVNGGLVGPTFACILGEQFRSLRKGDRFWYENAGFISSFNENQKDAIKKVTLSQIICRALDSGNSIQHQIFLPPSAPGNHRVKCVSGSRINLKPWKE